MKPQRQLKGTFCFLMCTTKEVQKLYMPLLFQLFDGTDDILSEQGQIIGDLESGVADLVSRVNDLEANSSHSGIFQLMNILKQKLNPFCN